MNIALSAVVIFILLLPPIAFYLSYNIGAFSKANPKLGLLEGLMLSAIFSIVIHAIALTFIHREVRFDILVLMLGGDLKSFNEKVSNEGFRQMLLNFVWYNASLVIGAIVLARICRWVILKKGWHVNSGILRLYNHWGYLFQGYKVDEVIGKRKPLNFDLIYVDAVVNTTAGTMIYSGYLIDFVYFGETLDRIYLSQTERREFKVNQQNDKGNILINKVGEPKDIDGDTLVIPYSGIINMNLHFIELPEGFADLEDSGSEEIEIAPSHT
jgi:hypothetical protein